MTDPLCIDANLLGTKSHLLINNEKNSWVEEVPKDAWHFSGKIKLHSDMCLDTVMALNHINPNTLPEQKFVTMMSSLIHDESVTIPWAKVLPPRDHRSFMTGLINVAIEAMEGLSRVYYMNTWVTGSAVLRSLQPAKISKSVYDLILENSEHNTRVIESFKPYDSGYARSVTYDRFGSRTGRLTVTNGPNILTLKREYRQMIQSSYKGGSIIYIDFSALEPRILLAEADVRCNEADLYSYISRELFSNTVPRAAIKQAVISELYGSSKFAVGEVLGVQGEELDEFLGRIKMFFRTNDLLKRVKGQFIETGKITNRFGRSLVIDDPVDHILINTYTQSTGVDVALLGFSNIVNQFKNNPAFRPLFVLHDALFVDVAPNCINEVLAITSVKVPGYVHPFLLTSQTLND